MVGEFETEDWFAECKKCGRGRFEHQFNVLC
jgi:hypothetical protein